MKKLVVVCMAIIMCFGAVGCAEGNDLYIDGVSGAKTVMTEGPVTKDDWHVVIPDYRTIFTEGDVAAESVTGKIFDYDGMYSMRINNITEEQYDKYVSEAAKVYFNVISESSFTTDDGAPHKGYSALDESGLYQLNLSLYEDNQSETMECLIFVYHFEEPKEI